MSLKFIRCSSQFIVFTTLLIFCQSCSDDPITSLENIDPDVPFAVTDLALTIDNQMLRLTWTATGDDGPNGTASRYDLRKHTEPLTKTNWAMATSISELENPLIAGSAESFILNFENGSPTIFLALKVIDDAGNISGISNVVYADLEAPTDITDLFVLHSDDTTALIKWTAPSDDGLLGHAARYEYRVSQQPLTPQNWDNSMPSNGPIVPLDSGAVETFALHSLTPSTHYYTAFRSYDESGNRSALSNIVEFETTVTPRGWWDGFDTMGANHFVSDVYAFEELLYVGGRFSQVGSLNTSGVAAWDGTGWSAMGSGLSGGQLGLPQGNAFSAFQGSLYLSGNFFQAGDATALNIAKWDGIAWEGLGDGPGSFGPSTLCVYGGNLYMGGQFNGGGASPFINLTGFDGTNFFSLSWPEEQFSSVQTLVEYDGNLVVGGYFGNTPGGNGRSVAFFDGSTWTNPHVPLTSFSRGPSISSSVVYNGELYIGGLFTSESDPDLTGIARWDGTSWQPVGKGMRTYPDEQPGVFAMTVFRGDLVVGGQFDKAGEVEAQNIAIWNGYFWSAMGEGVQSNSQFIGTVTCMANYQGSLYVGGIFDTAGGLPSRNVARWDVE